MTMTETTRGRTFPKLEPSQWDSNVYFCNAVCAGVVVAAPSSSIPPSSQPPVEASTTSDDKAGRHGVVVTSSHQQQQEPQKQQQQQQHHHDHHLYPPLPVGEPIPFETDLFKGRLLLRIRNLVRPTRGGTEKSDDGPHGGDAAYFAGKRRFYQMVVQGQFKERVGEEERGEQGSTTTKGMRRSLTFGDVVLGAKYERPFTGIPGRNSTVLKWIQGFVQRINPGMVFDIAADQPRVMTPIGTCQSLRVDRAGDEPDIRDVRGIVEDTTLLVATPESGGGRTGSGRKPPLPFVSAKQRREKLAKPKHSSRYAFDPDLVYTFENYDHTMDLGTYHQHFGPPGGGGGGVLSFKVDLADKLNGQPLSMTAMVKDTDEVIFDFHMWHERLWHNVVAANGVDAQR